MTVSERRPTRPALRRLFGLLLLVPALLGGCGVEQGAPSAAQASFMTGGGDAARGRAAIRAYGCDACHTIPGIPSADRIVGPELSGIHQRMYIAGVLPNSPENLILWIQDPTAIDPMTAMPNLNVGENEARDIAAYLYSR